MIERIHTSHRMSKIVKHNGTVYLCGQVGNGDDPIREQTAECLRRVDALLAEAGTGKENILHATIWLADIADKAAMDEVWEDWVPAGRAPTRACGEAKLGRPELKVEVIVVAASD